MKKALNYISHVREKEKPARFLISLFLKRTHLSKLIVIDRGLYKIRFYPSAISASLWMNPSSRIKEERLVKAYLKEGDVVVDVGANIGTVTLPAAALVGASGTVFAIEPHPRIFRYLQKNAALNNFTNIHFHDCALGESRGVVSLSDKSSDDLNCVVERDGIEVPVERLDDLLRGSEVKTISLLKIDVEGFEKQVLQGAPETLRKTRCVFIETIDRALERYSSTSSELFDILRTHGFSLYRPGKKTKDALAIKNLPDFLERADGFSLTAIREAPYKTSCRRF